MKGQIISIDITENIGTLNNESQVNYTFSLDDCVGFEDVPEIGMFVEFGLHGSDIFYIEPLSEDVNSLMDQIQNIKAPVQEKEEESPKFITPRTNNKKHNTEKINADIFPTLSIQESLNQYFVDVVYSIEEYEAQFEDFEELDYLLMKRFLNTAYNNLRDMDSGFMDEELQELRSDLEALDGIYAKFVKKDAVPEIAYENIFLEKQKGYKDYKHRLESNSSEIHTLESSMKTIEAQIKQYEDKIKQKKVLKDVINEWIKDLKRYKTYYVDTLHKVALLKEENILLQEALKKFAQTYKEEFLESYSQKSQEYFGLLHRQLNGYAYVFDRKMWERAESSNAILAFFKRAHIDEDFSSKTFLKYFIKTLDKTKLSKEFKKLEKLLEYLESKAKLRTLIVHENSTKIDSIKHCIRRLDKDYIVENVEKPRTIYYRKDLKVIDFIFVDIGMKNPPIEEFLTMLFSRLKQTKSQAKVCLVSKLVTKDMIVSAKKFSIDYFISLQVKEDELQENVKNIIEQ